MTAADPAARVVCPNCKGVLDAVDYNLPGLAPCRHCKSQLQAVVFGALRSSGLDGRSGVPAAEGESVCYFHSSKRAEVPCDQCGRFLCGLCDIEFRAEHWCAACLREGVGKQSRPFFVKRRTHYDSMALLLATIPFLFFIWPSIIGGPAALYSAIKYWNQPAGIMPRTRARLYIAVAFATLQIVGWLWLAIYTVMRLRGAV